jgi:hypothetical protein
MPEEYIPLGQARHTSPLLENVPAGQRSHTESDVTIPKPGMLHLQTVTVMGKFKVADVPIPSDVPRVPEPTNVVKTSPG